ncbi:MAG: aminotransferase, partial [Chloroflexi bacterium]
MTPEKQINLRIPGPTPVPPDILEAVGRPMINHRGGPFAAIVGRITAHLKTFFITQREVMAPSCAGTAGLEAALVNVLSPGDKVLGVSIGSFGNRFGTIA